jgi:hypothetical protein
MDGMEHLHFPDIVRQGEDGGSGIEVVIMWWTAIAK